MAYYPFQQKRSVSHDFKPVFTSETSRVDDARLVDIDADASTSNSGFNLNVDFDELKNIMSKVQNTITDFSTRSMEQLISDFESKCKEESAIMRRLDDAEAKYKAVASELKTLRDTIKEKEKFANILKQLKITETKKLEQIDHDKISIKKFLLRNSQKDSSRIDSHTQDEDSIPMKRPLQESVHVTPKKAKPNKPSPVAKNVAKANSNRNVEPNQEPAKFGVKSSRPVLKPGKKKTTDVPQPIPISKKADQNTNMRKNMSLNSRKEGQETRKQAEDKSRHPEGPPDSCELGYEEQDNLLEQNGEEAEAHSDNDIFAALEKPVITIKQEIKKEKDAETSTPTKTEFFKVNKPTKIEKNQAAEVASEGASEVSNPLPMKCNLCDASFTLEKEMKDHIKEAHPQDT